MSNSSLNNSSLPAFQVKIISFLLLFFVFWLTAAATHSGFYSKWKLRDSERYGIESILNGTAPKPFVYRQLAPATAKFIESQIPESLKSRLSSVNLGQKYTFKYKIVYGLNFLFTFLSLFALRKLLISQGISANVAVLSTITFILLTPYFQTIGGYYYDSIELFFMATAILFSISSKFYLLILITILATFNKESFLLFIPCLLPFLLQVERRRHALTTIALLVLIAGLINFYIQILYADNLESSTRFQLFRNLENYLSWRTYFQFELTYGLPGPKGANALTLVFILCVCFWGWRLLTKEVKQHTVIASLINFPLFFMYCRTGELRNLSFLYISFLILLAHVFTHGGSLSQKRCP